MRQKPSLPPLCKPPASLPPGPARPQLEDPSQGADAMTERPIITLPTRPTGPIGPPPIDRPSALSRRLRHARRSPLNPPGA
jgi:hypothetical protein